MSGEKSFKEIFKKGAIIYNPVLIQLAGLCPAIAAANDLRRAVMISLIMSIQITVTCVLASLLLKKIPRSIRMAVYLVIGLAISCAVTFYIETYTLLDLTLSLRIFIAIISANSITAIHCEQFAVKNSVKSSFYDAITVSIGASAVMLISAAVRELLGTSSIAGVPVKLPVTIKAMALPVGGLVMLGFLAAVLKAIVAAVYPEYAPEEITLLGIKLGKKRATEEDDTSEVELFDEFWAVAQEEEPQEVEVVHDINMEIFDVLNFDFDDPEEK